MVTRRLEKAELLLRLLAVLTAMVAFVLFITDKQVKAFHLFGDIVISKEARYSDMKSFVVSVIVLGIAAGYSILQFIRCFLGIYTNCSISLPFHAWCTFLLDQTLSYLVLSSSAATAESAYLAQRGNSHLGWSELSNTYRAFSNQAGAGMVGSFLLTMEMVVIAVLSAYSLFSTAPREGKPTTQMND